MNRSPIKTLLRVGLAGLLGACAAGQARAEFISFSSTVSLTPTSGFSGGPVGPGTSETLKTVGGTAVTLTGNAQGTSTSPIDASSSTNIILGSISASTNTATPRESVALGFVYTVTINDYGSITGGPVLGSTTFTVSGSLSGAVGAGIAVSLNNLSTYVASPSSFRLDDVNFTVGTIGPGVTGAFFTPPGAVVAGTFGAQITAAVPEPTTFALMGAGVLVMLAPRLRRLTRRIASGASA